MDNSYFSHDSNARNSTKLLKVRSELSLAGYAIYFMLLERLREEPNYMSVRDYNAIAFDLRANSGDIKKVIENYGLFIFTDDGKCFYSDSFLKRMKIKDDKSEKAKQAANQRWNKDTTNEVVTSDSDANAMPTHSECNADAMQVKESKGNKRKDLEEPKGSLSDTPTPSEILDSPIPEPLDDPPKDPEPEKKESCAKEKREYCQRVVDYFNKTCVSLPRVQILSDERIETIMARTREHGKEKIKQAIDQASISDFLAGQNKRDFSADFGWIFRPRNFIKVLEGNYSRKGGNDALPPPKVRNYDE